MNKSLAAKVVGVCLIFLLAGVYVGYSASPSLILTISGGVYPGAISYTIYSVNSVYYGKDQNGDNEFSGSDVDVVIQNCIDMSNGGTIKFALGEYVIDNTLTINSEMSIVGESSENGEVCKIVADVGFTDYLFNVSVYPVHQAVSFSNLNLEGSKGVYVSESKIYMTGVTVDAYQALTLYRVIWGNFYNCFFKGLGDTASSSPGILLTYNVTDNMGTTWATFQKCSIEPVEYYGIKVDDLCQVRILDCWIEGTADYFIYAGALGSVEVDNTDFAGNVGYQGVGIYSSGDLYVTNSRLRYMYGGIRQIKGNGVFVGNEFGYYSRFPTQTQGTLTSYACYFGTLTNSTVFSSNFVGGSLVLDTGSRINAFGKNGVYANNVFNVFKSGGIDVRENFNSVTGNEFITGNDGVYVENCSYVLVANNIFYNMTSRGIYEKGTADYNFFTGNVIYSCGTPITIVGANTNSTNNYTP